MPFKDATTSGAERPSSNWLRLQKSLSVSKRAEDKVVGCPAKRRKTCHGSNTVEPSPGPSAVSDSTEPQDDRAISHETSRWKNGQSLDLLREMIHGKLSYSPNQMLPGKYLALDCEMVGVGEDAAESSLARVSIVNYHGAVQMDEYVRQKERVVDFRTQYSGVRHSDLIKATPFEEVQRRVADLLKDRILVGHALSNDLKALLLTHPRTQTRDTQFLASKHKLTTSRRPALRHLVEQEIGVLIQSGEHCSVTDARATMAVFRLHHREWEKGQRPAISALPGEPSKSRKRAAERTHGITVADDAHPSVSPALESRGISSGLAMIAKRKQPRSEGRGFDDVSTARNAPKFAGQKAKWWKEL